jgi:hypothetical protein
MGLSGGGITDHTLRPSNVMTFGEHETTSPSSNDAS